MSKPLTPLRYPGGKSILSSFFESFIECNNFQNTIYIEPYCGGAGAAINLLFSGKVSEIWLNDVNYSIFSFWYAVKYYSKEFLNLLKDTDVSIQEWQNQRVIFQSNSNKTYSKENILINGFATFFLNRCNRSGILNAGPIGGQSDEAQKSANYKITARFNKEELSDRIKEISKRGNCINISNLDALELLRKINRQPLGWQKRCFVYLDPPYYNQGSGLYLNYYKNEDHKKIAEFLALKTNFKWILSYDDVPEIRILYPSFNQFSFFLNYSAQNSKVGSELVIHSNNSVLPQSMLINRSKRTKKIMELFAV